MSAVGLFLAGVLVTLIVAVAVTLPILGAILDGRDERARLESEPGSPVQHLPALKLVDDSDVIDAA